MESIPVEERSKDVKTLDLSYDDFPIERALCVQWCVESDTFKFRVTVKDKPVTRRGILSTISSIYDHLGFAAPFTPAAKKILQLQRKYSRTSVEKRRLVGTTNFLAPITAAGEWLKELPLLERLSVPRCVKPVDFGEVKSRQIHIFSDASNVGYGSVAYQRLCDNEGRTHCSFLMGKTRLAPIKAVTVPHLELTAATVSVRLAEIIKKELHDKAETIQYHTVLRYIANNQKRFHVYVANRVQLIRNLSDPNQWR